MCHQFGLAKVGSGFLDEASCVDDILGEQVDDLQEFIVRIPIAQCTFDFVEKLLVIGAMWHGLPVWRNNAMHWLVADVGDRDVVVAGGLRMSSSR